MSKFTYCKLMDCQGEKMMRLQTVGDYEIPVNIVIDNADEFSLSEDDVCEVDVYAHAAGEMTFYEDEAAYDADETTGAMPSMIPVGTFPSGEEKDKGFKQSSHILFTGTVAEVEWGEDVHEGEPNCCLLVDALELRFYLYLYTDYPVKVGNVIHGVAWLFGDITEVCDEEALW